MSALPQAEYSTAFKISLILLLGRIRAVLTPDLLLPLFAHLRAINMQSPDLATRERARYMGHCYAASEAAYHLLGGRDAGLTPCTVKHEGATHWYLRTCAGTIIDPTASQFIRPVPYHLGRGRGFLTRAPSKRAQTIINRACSNETSARVIIERLQKC